MSKKDGKEQKLKAEYPLNSYGLGFRSTLENGPYFKDDVGYVEPLDNFYGGHCGGCAFYNGGKCEAVEEEVHILSACKLYINMEMELDLRHQQYFLQATAKSEDGELELVEKYISQENGKYCVRSHQTGKSFGCYSTRAQAEKRLAQIKRFKDKEEVPGDDEETSVEEVALEVKFASADEEKRLVYGIALVPDETDFHTDTISAEEIEKAAHKYLKSSRIVGYGHTKKTKAYPVESFIYNPEVLKEVKEGSWVLVVKVESDAVWEEIKSGDLTGFSIGAMVRRNKLPVEEEDED